MRINTVFTVAIVIVSLFVIFTPNISCAKNVDAERKAALLSLHSDLKPNEHIPFIFSWAIIHLTESLSLSFNEPDRLARSEVWYTDQGQKEFRAFLEKSKILEHSKRDGTIITTVVEHVPIIAAQGRVEGGYRWDLTLDLLSTVQQGTARKSNKYKVLLTIQEFTTAEESLIHITGLKAQ